MDAALCCCCSPAVENETVVLPWVIDLTPASVVELLPLSEVANTEKKVPLEWINEEGNGVKQGFIDYCLPLIQGETGMVKEDGLPRFVKLKKVFAK